MAQSIGIGSELCNEFVWFATANASVLRWWFHGRNASLIMDNRFHSSLALSPDERVWEVQLSGDNANKLW